MSLELIKTGGIKLKPSNWLNDFQVKSVDASVITEPGSTGTDWRLHYSMNLFDLQCDQFIITCPGIGKSFLNFEVNVRDLFLGDRAYGRLKGMKYKREKGGHFTVHIKNKAFTIYRNHKKFCMVDEFKSLKVG